MSSRKYKKMASAEGFIKSNPTDFSDWENSVSLYGDSCTWGYDIPDEQRLHNIIETDRIVNNFGYPGESNVHMLMRFLDHIEKYGYPHMVVMGWSSPYRMAKFANQQVEPFGGWERNFQEVADNNKTQFQKYNLLLFETVRTMCNGRSCKLLEWTFYSGSYSDKRIFYPDKLDVAKDGKHPGPKSIELVARKIEYDLW